MKYFLQEEFSKYIYLDEKLLKKYTYNELKKNESSNSIILAHIKYSQHLDPELRFELWCQRIKNVINKRYFLGKLYSLEKWKKKLKNKSLLISMCLRKRKLLKKKNKKKKKLIKITFFKFLLKNKNLTKKRLSKVKRWFSQIFLLNKNKNLSLINNEKAYKHKKAKYFKINRLYQNCITNYIFHLHLNPVRDNYLVEAKNGMKNDINFLLKEMSEQYLENFKLNLEINIRLFCFFKFYDVNVFLFNDFGNFLNFFTKNLKLFNKIFFNNSVVRFYKLKALQQNKTILNSFNLLTNKKWCFEQPHKFFKKITRFIYLYNKRIYLSNKKLLRYKKKKLIKLEKYILLVINKFYNMQNQNSIKKFRIFYDFIVVGDLIQRYIFNYKYLYKNFKKRIKAKIQLKKIIILQLILGQIIYDFYYNYVSIFVNVCERVPYFYKKNKPKFVQDISSASEGKKYILLYKYKIKKRNFHKLFKFIKNKKQFLIINNNFFLFLNRFLNKYYYCSTNKLEQHVKLLNLINIKKIIYLKNMYFINNLLKNYFILKQIFDKEKNIKIKINKNLKFFVIFKDLNYNIKIYNIGNLCKFRQYMKKIKKIF